MKKTKISKTDSKKIEESLKKMEKELLENALKIEELPTFAMYQIEEKLKKLEKEEKRERKKERKRKKRKK